MLCSCMAFFCFVGCDVDFGSGGSGGGSGSGEEQTVTLLDGVKVLTRPSGYNFGEAVGQYSENYYNIFAGYILKYLYKVYSDININDPESDDYKAIYTNIDLGNGATFSNATAEEKLYLYDSIRYTFASVANTVQSGEITQQTITLDTSKSWNWTISPIAFKESESGGEGNNFTKIYFYNSPDYGTLITITSNNNEYEIEFNIKDSSFEDWKQFSLTDFLSDYHNSYYGGEKAIDGSSIIDYFNSPYYSAVKGNGSSPTNYYQDALEYAIYMTVMGYDMTSDPDFFNFQIAKDASGFVSGMTVGGWETNPISVSSSDGALARAKDRYAKTANYVGVTETDIDNIVDIILTKVIGGNTPDKFTVDGKNFNRNYQKIVSNIVKYACEQAPIGFSDGNKITLGQSYLSSKITDYKGDAFEQYVYVDENGEKNDSEPFKHIAAEEYQSLVFDPKEEDLGKKLQSIVLMFEYYDNPGESIGKVMADSISMNVGFRYYNNTTKTLTKVQCGDTFVVKNLKNGDEYSNGDGGNPRTMLFITKGADGYGVDLEEDVILNTKFISPEPIDTTKIDGAVKEGDKTSTTISGLSDARNYYKLEKSSSYGQYGVLDETKVDCDFIEIYFDILKDKNNSNINYCFKVVATLMFEDV